MCHRLGVTHLGVVQQRRRAAQPILSTVPEKHLVRKIARLRRGPMLSWSTRHCTASASELLRFGLSCVCFLWRIVWRAPGSLEVFPERFLLEPTLPLPPPPSPPRPSRTHSNCPWLEPQFRAASSFKAASAAAGCSNKRRGYRLVC